jgi:hypothetical protein
MSFLSRLFRRNESPLPAPQLDEPVAQRLAREGKDLSQVDLAAAEPREIPAKPALPGFKGMVSFEMTIDTAGAVKAVAMTGAPYEHVQLLETWAYAWIFHPARMEGNPHACRMTFEVTW